ncbi:hypothetical protein D3C87_1689940 [compost metagenome]
MAKHPLEAGKPNLTPIITLGRFRHPYPVKCAGCSRLADYEVYETRQPHCKEHMLEAVDSESYVIVRKLNGFDDAS